MACPRRTPSRGLSPQNPTGTYPDAVISLMATKGGVMEGLDIPIKLIVEA